MKRVLGVLIIGFLSAIVLANTYKQEPATGIQFFKGSFEEGLAKAKEEKKLIFLDAYAAWCGPCKLMSKRVFTDPKVAEYYNSNFVNLKIDMEKGEGPKLAAKYNVQAYPTLFFINDKGELVHKNIGFLAVEDFIKFGEEAMGK